MACQCQYGLSALLMGPIILICAGLFRLLGVWLDLNGVAWFFWMNMFWFGLGGFLTVFGVVAECCTGKKAKAREPLLEDGLVDENGIARAPVPYIMINA